MSRSRSPLCSVRLVHRVGRWKLSCVGLKFSDAFPYGSCASLVCSLGHLGFASLSSCVSLQLADFKKKLEQEAQSLQSSEDGRKRLQRELESTRLQQEEKEAAYDKLNKTKTRQQQELEDLTLDQDNSRQCILSLEKKQRKFDQVSTVLSQLQLTF